LTSKVKEYGVAKPGVGYDNAIVLISKACNLSIEKGSVRVLPSPTLKETRAAHADFSSRPITLANTRRAISTLTAGSFLLMIG
jgi:hypothetical protein